MVLFESSSCDGGHNGGEEFNDCLCYTCSLFKFVRGLHIYIDIQDGQVVKRVPEMNI